MREEYHNNNNNNIMCTPLLNFSPVCCRFSTFAYFLFVVDNIILTPPLSTYLKGGFKEACPLQLVGWLVSTIQPRGKEHLSLYTFWLEAPKLFQAPHALGSSSRRPHRLLLHQMFAGTNHIIRI